MDTGLQHFELKTDQFVRFSTRDDQMQPKLLTKTGKLMENKVLKTKALCTWDFILCIVAISIVRISK